MLGPHPQEWGECGEEAHLLHLVVLILIRLLAVVLLEFCSLFKGLLLWAAGGRRGNGVRGLDLAGHVRGVAWRGEACLVRRSQDRTRFLLCRVWLPFSPPPLRPQ